MHSIIAGIANSFTDNLIAEQHYRMILDGLQVTLLITFCAAVLGTLLGGVVCWARMSRKPWLMAVGGVKQVYTNLISTPAREMLEKAGIQVFASEEVEMILNRDKTGQCPMDQSLNETDDPAECVAMLKNR